MRYVPGMIGLSILAIRLVVWIVKSATGSSGDKEVQVTSRLPVKEEVIKSLDLALGERVTLISVPDTYQIRILVKGTELGKVEDKELYYRAHVNKVRTRVCDFDDQSVTVEFIYLS